MSKEKFTFIDLFAGCGGLSEGFLESGKFKALAHVEWETPMVNTLRNRLVQKWNHSENDSSEQVIHFDIQKTEELIHGDWKEDSVLNYGKTNSMLVQNKGLKGVVGKNNVDIIIGGPPCQAYSIAGRAQDKNGMDDDYRNYLFESFVKVVDAFKPKLFVFENVPGMLSATPGGIKVTERVFKAFKDIGYQISKPNNLKNNVYSSDDFSVAQKRKRLIIVGVNLNEPKLNLSKIYKYIDLQKSNKKITIKDVLFGLPKFKPLIEAIKEGNKNVSHVKLDSEVVKQHSPRFHNLRDVKIFKEWILNGMNKKPLAERIEFYNKLMNKNSKHAKYRNLEWEKQSPTIVAHLYKDGLMFIHPDKDQARSITIKEAAILQSFPMDFDFLGSNGACYKMIGNAVPPKMAEGIAHGIYNYLKTK